jgi:hypothetical protein
MSPQLKIENGGNEENDMGYSIQIKETVLQKALSGKKPQHEKAKNSAWENLQSGTG